MAEIHQLIIKHGRDEAKRLVSVEDRQYVDIAARMLAEENPALGITYSGFCLTALPHKRLEDDAVWRRQGHKVRLIIEPGRLPLPGGEDKLYGVPFGSRARLMLLYLQTRAIQTSCPEVELGRSMREWMSRMGVPIGGKSYRDIKEQANRISACNLTFVWDDDGRKAKFAKDSIVKGGIQLYEAEDDNQPRLWIDTVRLGDNFYKALTDHPVPIAEPALRHISNQSMAIDVYIWLAYRLHSLDKPAPVTWAALHGQFGAGYDRIRKFKERFVEPLKAALAVYPEADVEITDEALILKPSAPPIPERQFLAR